MADNNDIKFYPDEQTRSELLAFQEENELTKSKATEELVQTGLAAKQSGIMDVLYWELAKITGTIGLVLVMLYNLEGALNLPLWWYGIVLVIAAFLFMGLDHVDFSIRDVLGYNTNELEDPTGT